MGKTIAALAAALMAVLAAAPAGAQAPASAPPPTPPAMRGDGPPPAARRFSVTRADPDLDAVVPRGARLELMAQGFGLNEGPV